MHYTPETYGYGTLVKMLDCALGLKRRLVGVTFLRTKAAFDDCEAVLARKPLSYCSLVRMASGGRGRKASIREIACPGARRALGMEPVNEEFSSGERYLSLGLYKDQACAREASAAVSLMDRPVVGVAVQPLADCEAPPHVVISICDPNQAMRLVQGYIHGRGPLDPMRCMGMQGLCAELTVRPHLTGRPNVSLLCSNTRYTCAWSDGELGVGVPFGALPELVDGVFETLDAVESDSRKQDILARSREMGIQVDAVKGGAYYQSPPKATAVPTREEAPAAAKSAPPSGKLSIEVHGVSKTHTLKCGSVIKALDNVSLQVRDREFLTLVGPSGCGKSTLLNIMAGRYAPDAGTVRLHGRHSEQGLNLGFISQADTLLPWRTVRKNVELGLEMRNVPPKQRRETADRLMAQVGLLDFARSYPFELSGGMKQRASVIRALAYDPDIIFMDEPFVGLDVQTRDALEEDILNLWQTHRKTIVMVTHDLGEAITLSDRVVLFSGRPAQVLAEYDIPLPRPRSVVESKFSEAFVSIHKSIWEALSAEVLKTTKGRPHA